MSPARRRPTPAQLAVLRLLLEPDGVELVIRGGLGAKLALSLADYKRKQTRVQKLERQLRAAILDMFDAADTFRRKLAKETP